MKTHNAVKEFVHTKPTIIVRIMLIILRKMTVLKKQIILIQYVKGKKDRNTQPILRQV